MAFDWSRTNFCRCGSKLTRVDAEWVDGDGLSVITLMGQRHAHQPKYFNREWIKAAVGMHWSRGEYAISTYQRGGESGYVLVKNRQTVGKYKTFEEAEQHAK